MESINKKRILVACGTRPEVIKMAPIIHTIRAHASHFECLVLNTGQHPHLTKPLFDWFQIKPDLTLPPKDTQGNIVESSAHILQASDAILKMARPDILLVQGDTTSVFALATSAQFNKIAVGHIEAGLRTYDRYNPFPEEINRRLVSVLSNIHFAPTAQSASNLEREGIAKNSIHCVGNTVIDALQWTIDRTQAAPLELKPGEYFIFATLHRRENQGDTLVNIFKAMDSFLQKNPSYKLLLPLHPNPKIREDFANAQVKCERFLVKYNSLEYPEAIAAIKHANLILTDSGGIQEEASFLGKKTWILRSSTERPEVLMESWIECIGNSATVLGEKLDAFSKNPTSIHETRPSFHFGQGDSAKKIANYLENFFFNKSE